jgi:F-type H+-transporting ATPase subunit c
MAMVTAAAAAASVSSTAFAAGPTKADLSMTHGGAMAIAAALAISVAAVGGALGQGKAAMAALEGIARNPGAAGKIQTPMILSLALIESLVIYALLIAFQLVPGV